MWVCEAGPDRAGMFGARTATAASPLLTCCAGRPAPEGKDEVGAFRLPPAGEDGREATRRGQVWRTRLLALTRSLAELVWGGAKRPGRTRMTVMCVLRFGSTCPLRRSCSCVRIGPSERLSALIPKSPRTGAHQGQSANRLDPRRCAIGGFTIPRPVAPRCSSDEASGGPGSIQRTDHLRPRRVTARPRSAPSPSPLLGRIQAPPPATGTAVIMREVWAPRIGAINYFTRG